MTKANFGYKEVEEKQKQPMVQEVFSTVAHRYDLMNDIMSFGMHYWWKDELIREISPAEGDTLLDVAGGTGDISRKFIKAGGEHATVLDLNKEMLEHGKTKENNHGLDWVHANAEKLPFEDNTFDYYTISFGIRNVTHIDVALKEAHRVLKPGGKFVCLEFSHMNNKALSKLYDLYSFRIIPKVGKWVTGSSESYQYLVESIRNFPKASQFAEMVKEAGFNEADYRKLTFGAVAIHSGYKV